MEFRTILGKAGPTEEEKVFLPQLNHNPGPTGAQDPLLLLEGCPSTLTPDLCPQDSIRDLRSGAEPPGIQIRKISSILHVLNIQI